MSVRVFLLDDTGELVRFPYARFSRLWRHDPLESLPKSSTRFVCFALAYVQLVDRQPYRLLDIEYPRYQLDAEGRFDQEAVQRSLQAAAKMTEAYFFKPAEDESNVIRAEHRFYRARYKGEFNWKPSPKQREELYHLAMR